MQAAAKKKKKAQLFEISELSPRCYKLLSAPFYCIEINTSSQNYDQNLKKT